MERKGQVKEWRIFVEEANGLTNIGSGKGHAYFDRTDQPIPTIQGEPAD